MADSMRFPDTFDEFAEQYKIIDKEEVYTNGSELIPIFRVKQWLEHKADVVEVVRCEDCQHKEQCPESLIIEGKDKYLVFCSCGAKMDE